MKNRMLILCLLFSFSVQAEEASSGIHVDIDEIVAAGQVQSVGGITSAGQPDEEALRVFADSGYVAVLDMRGPDENRGMEDEQAAVEALGMDYIAFPIASRDQINFAKAQELDVLLQEIEGPVLLHCGSGNRVGAVLALRHSLGGADDEESVAHGKDAGLTRLEDVVRDRLTAD